MKHVNLKELNTYVYIDASNIKNALRVSGITLDWEKLYQYCKSTYIKLQNIMYFEGIDCEDKMKQKEFSKLKNIGYILKTLSRKSYTHPPITKSFVCNNCQQKNVVKVLNKSIKLKSNVDVFLCSEIMGNIINISAPTHLIIMSCDGDYAEMIRKMLELNKNIYISILATPFTKTNNYLSIRLKELERVDRYFLVNILNIKDRICNQAQKKRVTPKWDSRTVDNYIKNN